MFVQGVGGMTAVQTAYGSPTATLNESVMFEFSDSSGMSYRTTDKLGVAIATGDGGEGSPIETDPLGGSVGTFTPYFQPIAYQPRQDFPDLQPFNTRNYDTPGPDFNSLYSFYGSRVADLPGFGTNWGTFAQLGEQQYEERVNNSRFGLGFRTNEQLGANPGAKLLGFGYTRADGSRQGGTWTLAEALRKSDNDPDSLFENWDETHDPFGDSQQQDPYTQTPLTEPQRRGLEDLAKKFIGDGPCNKFISGVLEKLKSTGSAGYATTDVGKLLTELLANANNRFLSVNFLEAKEKGLKDRAPLGTTTFGALGQTKITTIRLDSYVFGFSQGNVFGKRYQYSGFQAGLTLVHELIHSYGGKEWFSHTQLAQAGFASASRLGIRADGPPIDDGSHDDFDQASSTYFDRLLELACQGVKK